MPARRFPRIPLLLAVLLLAACRSVEFYRQAAAGQWQISRSARPFAEVLKDPATPDRVREKLRLVEELRAFAARELSLPADSQYDRYCDLRRKYVVWVVFAAPEFSVEAKTWTYPLVGSLKYRGFFSEEAASAESARLRAAGYDVHQTGTEAYSTLGWLRDPVLNTFLRRSDAELAELIFHELTHQRVYLSGDTDFNEAFATAVGEEGARRWLRSRGRLTELKQYESRRRLQRAIVTAMLDSRSRLDRLYRGPDAADAASLRRQKAAELTALHGRALALRIAHGVHTPIPGAPDHGLNNATLNSVAAYYTLLPGFERLLASEEGDIPRFIARVAAMKHLTRAQRHASLEVAHP